uniref:Uncharacterized protein n=1 Tax=Plectus sambesii TaxID=2011161 RepID=A0A914VG67_9BILA
VHPAAVQHPNSPLEPLDPHRFRDMVVDKQQQGGHPHPNTPGAQQTTTPIYRMPGTPSTPQQ